MSAVHVLFILPPHRVRDRAEEVLGVLGNTGAAPYADRIPGVHFVFAILAGCPHRRGVVNLGRRFADSLSKQAAVLVLALASSLVAAYLMYWLVERPAQTWSSAVSYATKTNLEQASST